MPSYTFEHKETGELMDLICSYDEAMTIDKDGEYKLLPCSPMIVSGTGTVLGKVDNGFNDVLQKVKSNHYGSNILTK